MLYVTHYESVGEPSKERTQELMALFAERGSGPGTLAHYVYADGGGGLVIADDSALDALYGDAIQYSPYLEFSTRPILMVEDAIPTIVEWMSN